MVVALLMMIFGAVGVLLGILIHVRRIEKAVDKIAGWLFGLTIEATSKEAHWVHESRNNIQGNTDRPRPDEPIQLLYVSATRIECRYDNPHTTQK